MIKYKKCSEVDLEQVYEAFQAGFSDYIIKMTIPREHFYESFFEREANSLEYSFIALDDERPIGIIFGGLKTYEGTPTLRCGALCVAKEYRGLGVSKELFELHKQLAVSCGCKQLYLEVIVGNDRAISFYKKLGYEKVYDIAYYSFKNASEISSRAAYDVKELGWEQLADIAGGITTHVNWQNELDYAKRVKGVKNYGIYCEGVLAGALTVTESGKIFFLYTRPTFRHRGLASALLAHAGQGFKLNALQISFPNNASLEGFVKKKGFVRNELSQYEMYMPLMSTEI